MRIPEVDILIDECRSDDGFHVVIPVIDVNGTSDAVLSAARRSRHIRVREQLQTQSEIPEKGIQRDTSPEDIFGRAHIVSDRCRQNVRICEICVNINGSRRVDVSVISDRCLDRRLHHGHGHRHCQTQLCGRVGHNLGRVGVLNHVPHFGRDVHVS